MPTQKRERKRQGRHARQEYLQAQRRKAKLRRQAMIVLVVVGLVLGAALFFSRDGGDNVATNSTTTTVAGAIPKAEPVANDSKVTGDTPCPPADGSAKPTYKFEKPAPMCIDPAKANVAVMTTSEGVIEITLDTQKTPKTANNFAVLSRYHYYDGTALFRTNTGIDIIQGGSPHTQFNDDPGPGYTIEDEGTGFKYAEGDLVMARSQGPNSASAQFFFASGPKTSALDSQGTYVTFGKVTSGLDVVKAIMALHRDDPTAQGGPGEGGPSKLVIIEKIEIVEK
ncbi:MAG TPA: peptidylprolyl isomerase [Acidimicrobiales bacterium]|nr:peptidylprolyl isomerase [Acidimicrobiales bacterium]